jgi:Chromo (CHRromatin Organisation MOdifier) domain
VSKILDERYNEQEMLHELLVAWRDFPVGEATWEPLISYGCECSEHGGEVHEFHEDIDTVRMMRSLWVLSWGSVMRC